MSLNGMTRMDLLGATGKTIIENTKSFSVKSIRGI
jgi:hypothetical protein